MQKDEKIFVAGYEALALDARASRAMIASAILRRLRQAGFTKAVTRTAAELDLTDQKMVLRFFRDERPDYVFLASVKVGGILANTKYPAEFIYDNLQGQTNVIHAAWQSGVKKLLFLASSCIYPKDCPQPMREEYLLSGQVEPTSEPYAIAKIAGIKMCQSYNRQYGTDYISAVPADLYGPNDNFDPETSHVLPALIRKIDEAKIHNQPQVIVWGTGTPRRECLYVDDLSDACIFLMNSYSGVQSSGLQNDESAMINIGTGADLSIGELARVVSDIIGFKGDLIFDKSKADGAPRKLLDTTKIRKLGWAPKISLEEGIRQTYRWYQNYALAALDVRAQAQDT